MKKFRIKLSNFNSKEIGLKFNFLDQILSKIVAPMIKYYFEIPMIVKACLFN